MALGAFVRKRHSPSPDTIVYETYSIDPTKHDGVIGRVFEGKGLWTWDNSLDLASDDLNFYDLDKSEQIDVLVDFIRKSEEVVCEFRRTDNEIRNSSN